MTKIDNVFKSALSKFGIPMKNLCLAFKINCGSAFSNYLTKYRKLCQESMVGFIIQATFEYGINVHLGINIQVGVSLKII